jgi:hypothetical protein
MGVNRNLQGQKKYMHQRNGVTRRKLQCRTGLPHGGQDLLGNTNVALVPYVAIVIIKTKTRGQVLTNRSQLLNTLGSGYARAIQ